LAKQSAVGPRARAPSIHERGDRDRWIEIIPQIFSTGHCTIRDRDRLAPCLQKRDDDASRGSPGAKDDGVRVFIWELTFIEGSPEAGDIGVVTDQVTVAVDDRIGALIDHQRVFRSLAQKNFDFRLQLPDFGVIKGQICGLKRLPLRPSFLSGGQSVSLRFKRGRR
jgi:hypothetical protein